MIKNLAGICFLDFDGVLNRIDETLPNLPGVDHGLERECVEGVARFVKRFGLGVVVSSSWRQDFTLPELDGFLRLHGGDAIANRLCGITITIPKTAERPHCRAQEVEETRRLFLGFGGPYVILDDSPKHRFAAAHVVLTNGRLGFRQEDAARGAALLAQQGIQSP